MWMAGPGWLAEPWLGVFAEVGQTRFLQQAMGDVDAKAVGAGIEPEAQDIEELGLHLRVVPVEVGLLRVEQV